MIDKEIYNSLLNIFYGYEEYVFYNKKEYIDSFLFAQKFLYIENDENNPLYKIINGWKHSLSNKFPVINQSIQIYLTNKCNLKCKHCYVQKNNNYISLDNYNLIVDKCIQAYEKFNTEMSIEEIVLGGGECTLHPQFKEILIQALLRFKKVTILTNLINLPNDILELYKTYKNKIYIKTSIDGLETTHDFIRGIGTYTKTFNNIKLLLDNNIDVTVQFVVNNLNYKEYFNFYKKMTSIGVKNIYCNRYCDTNNMEVRPLSEKELNEFIQQANHCITKKENSFINEGTSRCYIGNIFVVDWNGNLKPCMKYNDILLNILEADIEDIVKTIKLIRLKHRIIPESCFSCDDKEHCGGGEICIVEQDFNNTYTQDKMCVLQKHTQRNTYSYKDLFFLIRNDNEETYNFHKYCNLIKDRFGFFEKEQFHPLPEYNDSSLHYETSRRIKQLGEKNILWSGGIDSTYIICSYIKEKVPFNVVCDDSSIEDNLEFYKWMIKNNIPIIKFPNITQAYRIDNMLSGYLADTIFYLNTKKYSKEKSFYDIISNLNNRDELYESVINYGKHLNKPTNTLYEIMKLITYGLHYIHVNNEINYFIFPKKQIISFFNTKQFNDIAWTQYWYASENKQEMKNIICEITQNDIFLEMTKNPCKIKPRKQFITSNYYIPKYYYD